MIAGCDTFRSGAVEQLKKHCVKLGLELYQKGYGIEPVIVASQAMQEARVRGFDVVLIDTAGRMQDNQPLMHSLSKLVDAVKPNLTLFVGEALVGNDGLDQLLKFDKALAQTSKGVSSVRFLFLIYLISDTIDRWRHSNQV